MNRKPFGAAPFFYMGQHSMVPHPRKSMPAHLFRCGGGGGGGGCGGGGGGGGGLQSLYSLCSLC